MSSTDPTKPMLSFFAASGDQRVYFEALSDALNARGVAAHCVFYKSLPKLRWLIDCFRPLPTHVVEHIHQQVSILQARKELVRSKSPLGWWLFRRLARLRARALYCQARDWLKSESVAYLGLWNGKKFRQAVVVIAAEELGVPVLYFETGPLPGYSVSDPVGVDFYAGIPRDLDFYRAFSCTLDKEELIHIPAAPRPDGLPEQYVFVPLQVLEDSNIYLHSPWVRNMRHLYELICRFVERHPDRHFVLKPHPACPERYEDLYLRHANIHFVTDMPTTSLVQHAEAVVTINSTVGMEALLANKPVIVLGQAIYGIDGLTRPVQSFEQFEQALRHLDGCQPNSDDVAQFLCFLQSAYAVPGDAMQSPDKVHWDGMAQKVKAFLKGDQQACIGTNPSSAERKRSAL